MLILDTVVRICRGDELLRQRTTDVPLIKLSLLLIGSRSKFALDTTAKTRDTHLKIGNF